MKKRQLRTGRVLIAALTALVLIIAVAAGINFIPMLAMKPLATGPISGTDILAVSSGRNNLFLLPTDEGYIAIDAGTNADTVQKGLTQLDIDPADIAYVLLTHSDYDHVAALTIFPNAQICLGKDELPLVNGAAKRNLFSRNTLPAEIKLSELTLLTNGQELTIGEYTVRCLKVPGHTPGSMVYAVNSQYLFTGDAFQVKNDTVKLHPYTMSKTNAKASLQMIKAMLVKGRTVFTAHYGYFAAESLK